MATITYQNQLAGLLVPRETSRCKDTRRGFFELSSMALAAVGG